MNKKYILLLLIIAALFIAACSSSPSEPVQDWREIPLKDVSTGQEFKISEFSGEQVFVETFAVWCGNCKHQQDIIKDFKKNNPDVNIVSVNADPNEDEAKVMQHINTHGYDWLYTIAPEELRESMLNEFGFVILNAPSAPMVLICEDQSYSLLPTGVKTAEELQSAIENGC